MENDQNQEIQRLVGIAGKLVPALRLCIANIRLYPTDSEIIQKSLNTAFAIISKELEKEEHLILGEIEGKLLINTCSIPITDKKDHEKRGFENFLELLLRSHIKSITFKTGLTLDELNSFLKIFSEKYWRRDGDTKMFAKLLEESNIKHISINEWDYEHVGGSDLVLEKAKDFVDKTGNSLDDLMRSLEEVSELYELSEEETVRDRAKLAIAEKLTRMSPRLLIDFFEEKFAEGVEKVKGEIVAGMSLDKLKEIVINIALLYRDLKKDIPPGSEKEYELIRLRDTINMLLSSCEDREVRMAIGNELLKQNFKELLPLWLQQPELNELELIVSQANLLVQKDSMTMLEDETQEKLPGIFLELDKISKRELMLKLVENIEKNLDASVAGLRFRAVGLIKKLVPTFDKLANKDVIEGIYRKVFEAADRETDFITYDELGGILIKYVNFLVVSGEYDKASDIIQMFRRHSHEEGKGFAQRGEYAGKILGIFPNTEMMDIFMEDIKTTDKVKQKEAVKVVLYMGDAATKPLINGIKETRDFGTRKYIAEILRVIGKSAVLQLLQEINYEASENTLIRMIQVLPGMEHDDEAAEQLGKVINHHEKQVKMEVIRALDRLNSTRVGKILMIALMSEKDQSVLRETINIIGNKEYDPAIEEMVKLIKTVSVFKNEQVPEVIQEAVWRCLAKMPDEVVIPYLIRVIRKPNLFRFRRAKSKAVRITAIHAAKNFGTDEVLEALTVVRDRAGDETIRMAAENTIKVLIA